MSDCLLDKKNRDETSRTCEIDGIVVLCCHNREECRYSLHASVSKATAVIHRPVQQICVAI